MKMIINIVIIRVRAVCGEMEVTGAMQALAAEEGVSDVTEAETSPDWPWFPLLIQSILESS